MADADGGSIINVSSTASMNPSPTSEPYGAAKAGLSRYLEGLDHKFRARGLRVVTIKPGFVKTGMTEGLRPPPFAGEPEAVATAVLRAIVWSFCVVGLNRFLPRSGT